MLAFKTESTPSAPVFSDWNRDQFFLSKLLGFKKNENNSIGNAYIKQQAVEKLLKSYNLDYYKKNTLAYETQGIDFDENVLQPPALLGLSEGLGTAWVDFAKAVAGKKGAEIKDLITRALLLVDADDNDKFDLSEVVAWNQESPEAPVFRLSQGEEFFYKLSNGKEITSLSLAKFFSSKSDLPNNKLSLSVIKNLETLFPDLSKRLDKRDKEKGGVSADKLSQRFISDYDASTDPDMSLGDSILDYAEVESLIANNWNRPELGEFIKNAPNKTASKENGIAYVPISDFPL